LIYVDTSAMAKFVLEEDESVAFREFVRDKSGLTTSALTKTEFSRAVGRAAPSRLSEAHRRMTSVIFIAMSDEVLAAAAIVRPLSLRTLDAIQLASALLIRSEIESFVAYDLRLLEAAEALGLPTASPS
jgi:predicted nucleic acid-binding protein